MTHPTPNTATTRAVDIYKQRPRGHKCATSAGVKDMETNVINDGGNIGAMTLRAYFAGHAMQGLLAGNTEVLLSEEPKDDDKDIFDSCREAIVRDSVAYADALLTALAKGGV